MHHHHRFFDADSEHTGRRGHHEAFARKAFKQAFGPNATPGSVAGAFAQRARRGDIRAAILRLLSEQPMHGYQIIQELSERSGGAWSPSAGSVYPALQLLADEGLVVAEDTNGKKVFSLTDAGKAAQQENAEQPAPWDEAANQWPGKNGYHETVGKLMGAVFQVGKGGSPAQVKAAVEVLNDARKRLYAILGED